MTTVLVAPTGQVLTEAIALNEAMASPVKGHKFRAGLIKAGWSLNERYYSEAVLKRDGPKAWRAGAQMMGNHPSWRDDDERPEGSIFNVLSVLASDAYWDDDFGGLVADVKVMPQHADLLNEEFAKVIGLSIRARAMAEHGEAEGRDGLVITSFFEGATVDWVTTPGAGGAVLDLIESARGKELVEARNVGGWLEARLHERFTCIADDMYGDGYLTREERISLSGGIGEALKAFVERVTADAPQLFTRDLWVAPGSVPAAATESTSTPTPKEAPVADIDNGAPPAGGAPEAETEKVDATEAAADARVNDLEKRIKDMSGELAQARENARLSQSDSFKLAESRKENTGLRETVTRLQSIEAGRAAVAEAFGKSNLPQVALGKVTAAVIGLDGMNLPLAEGALDRAKLKDSIDAAILEESQYVAQISAGNGAGVVRGMGGTAQPAPVNEAVAKSALEATFKALGNMSDDEAARAAEGR